MASRKHNSHRPSLSGHSRIYKSKPIRKQHPAKNSPSTPSDFSTPRSPAILTPASHTVPGTHSLRGIVPLVRGLNRWLGYGQDTYLACLRLLDKLKFQIPTPKVKLVAAAAIGLSAKVHEYRTPKFSDLMHWGCQELNDEELTLQEA